MYLQLDLLLFFHKNVQKLLSVNLTNKSYYRLKSEDSRTS